MPMPSDPNAPPVPLGTPTPGITPGAPAPAPNVAGEPHVDPIHLVRLYPEEFLQGIESARAAAVAHGEAMAAAAEQILAAQQDPFDAVAPDDQSRQQAWQPQPSREA